MLLNTARRFLNEFLENNFAVDKLTSEVTCWTKGLQKRINPRSFLDISNQLVLAETTFLGPIYLAWLQYRLWLAGLYYQHAKRYKR